MTLEERLDRLESTEAIRQLGSRYSDAVDTADLSALGMMFVEDVRSSRTEPDGSRSIRVGRQEFMDWFGSTPTFGRPRAHFMGNHVIEFTGADSATGIVYGMVSAEQPDGSWTKTMLKYLDKYVRREGRWYFLTRKMEVLYVADLPVSARPDLGWAIKRKAFASA